MKHNPRKKGIEGCNQVLQILRSWGHIADGPFYKVVRVGRRPMQSHIDLFGIYDLVSYTEKNEGVVLFHQVTYLNMKSRKAKNIMKVGIPGLLWCRTKTPNEIEFRVFLVNPPEKSVKEIGKFKLEEEKK